MRQRRAVSSSMKKLLIIVLLCVAVVPLFTGCDRWFSAPERGRGLVHVSGNIEVAQVELSFKVPGRLKSRAVAEGTLVQAGQEVAQLESTEFQQEVTLRRAEVNIAGAMLAELEAGTRPQEIAQAGAALDLAKAEEERARIGHARQQELRKQGVATEREYEVADAVWKMAGAKVREAG